MLLLRAQNALACCVSAVPVCLHLSWSVRCNVVLKQLQLICNLAKYRSPVPQMMGGRLERATDEVADLVASRPPWMNGDPASFSEEQLREYKEYCAKEQAAIEERLKRKAVMVSRCT